MGDKEEVFVYTVHYQGMMQRGTLFIHGLVVIGG